VIPTQHPPLAPIIYIVIIIQCSFIFPVLHRAQGDFKLQGIKLYKVPADQKVLNRCFESLLPSPDKEYIENLRVFGLFNVLNRKYRGIQETQNDFVK